jgi:ribulose-phosphate 3-epimerase
MMLGRIYRIAPSILSADFAQLGDDVDGVIAAGADAIHFDVMDNHHVPNLTIGPLICEAIRRRVKVPIDVHLMVKPVDVLAGMFARAGADIISFHPKACEHIDRTLCMIRDCGCRAGLALNPATPLDVLDHEMDKLDLILVMSVNPGFGGQTFISEALAKLSRLRGRIDAHVARVGQPIWLEIEVGIKIENIGAIAQAGADTFVAGSAIFCARDADGGFRSVIDPMRRELATTASERAA